MLIKKLERKFNELKSEGRSEDSILIAFKEELQQYILHFIYTHRDYAHLTMYGGTVLRIGYKLPRMSEDLDFQTARRVNLEKFGEDIEDYFKRNYNFEIETKTRPNSTNRETDVIFIKFNILKNFQFESIKLSKLNIRVNINHFEQVDSFIKNTIPGGEGTDLNFTIKTYPLSTLMASKTAAFLKRNERGIGEIHTNVKPRDVFDMMWYMNQKIMPDLEYLKLKGLKFDTFLDFRDQVKLRANKIEDNAFRNDLSQFFFDINELEAWLTNWRPKFMQLLDSYKVYELVGLESIYFHIDFATEVRHILYKFKPNYDDSTKVVFEVLITDYWFEFSDLQINTGHRAKEIEAKVGKQQDEILTDLDYEYIGLFYKKINNYIKRNHNVIHQNRFTTKLIMATADELDPKKHLYLDKRLLEKIQFEELL